MDDLATRLNRLSKMGVDYVEVSPKFLGEIKDRIEELEVFARLVVEHSDDLAMCVAARKALKEDDDG